MKKMIIICLVATVLVFAGFGQNGSSGENTPVPVKIAFTGFTSTSIPESGLEILSELVKQEIFKTAEFILVDRELKDVLIDEQEFQLSDLANSGKAVELGEMLGASQIMTGKIGMLGKLYIITLVIIDVETGEVVSSHDHDYVGNLEDIRKPVRIAAQKTLGIKGIDVEQGQFVNVTTTPPGVRVYVDGLFEGNTPVKISLGKAGEHYVRLEASGYAPWTNRIKVDENSTYFIDATLLKQERIVDEKVRSLQDGRIPFILYSSIFAGVSSDVLLYSFGLDIEEYTKSYIALPLLVAPLTFYGTLRLTESEIMNPGRAIMIISSSLWGSSWGFTSAFAFGLLSVTDETFEFDFRPYAGLSVAGGVLYGGLATLLTMSDPFPANRAWLFNAGSVLGSLFGLGLPLLFNVEYPAAYYGSMLGGSLLGSGIALYMTRDMTVGTNVENLAYGGVINVNDGILSAGIPSISIHPSKSGKKSNAANTAVTVGLVSIKY